jgi:hypothetical protein
MDNFWLIPIVALLSGCIIGAGAIEYKVNIVWPNAIIEAQEMKALSCTEIVKKNSINDYWTPGNGVIGRALSDACKPNNDSGLNPYVEFCNPNDEFSPVKLIQNSTHKFDHETCIWNLN